MTKQEFLTMLDLLDEEIFKPYLDEIYQEAAEHYSDLIANGHDSDEAMYELITKSSYKTLKYAVTIALFLNSNITPDKPKTKKEMKDLLILLK